MAMVYPAENPRGKELFSILEERMKEERYDDEFLLLLIEYREMYPESEHFDIFYGRYAAFFGNYELALEHAEKAHGRHRVCPEVWRLLVKCYLALGRPDKAFIFQGYCYKINGAPLHITLPIEILSRCLGEFSIALGIGTYAPLCKTKCYLENGSLQIKVGAFCGEIIPVPSDNEGYVYWVGTYNETCMIGSVARLVQKTSNLQEFRETGAANFVHDVLRSQITRDIRIEGTPAILPIASTKDTRLVALQNEDVEGTVVIGRGEYSFLRLEKPTRISAPQPLAVGRPIPLEHSSKRRKFVLHILVDALSWEVIRENAYQDMPNLMKFFSQGVIFDQCFSVAEYTYPSLAAIETGMYPHHSQIFQENIVAHLDEKYITIAEQMKNLGYYCVNLMGGGDGIYNDVTRGYDRLLVTSYDLTAYLGVERVIRHMEAFSECDSFIFLHVGDLHPWSSRSNPIPINVQTKLQIKERLNGEEKVLPSIYLPSTKLYQASYQENMKRVDRNLGALFDYILEHYKEDDYVVQLYSDHGASIYGGVPKILNAGQTHSAYMLRGFGVPRKGIVGELTSSVDIYPVLGKLAGFSVGENVDGNLPLTFGGKERECVYSNSLYPGQTYKLCIRTKSHEFYLESLTPVDISGTVDLSGAKMSIRGRMSGGEISTELEEYFLRLAKEYTASINNGGRQWRLLREVRK